MIIKYPTALYKSIIPTSPDVSGNITYTISSESPPKYDNNLLQLPLDQEIRTYPDRIYTKDTARKFNGKLVFDMTIPSKSTDGSNSKQFEIGQTLDFTDSSSTNVDGYNLESIELRQDLSVVDYSRYGLNDDEYEELINTARKQMDSITLEISKTGSDLNINNDSIMKNQADINQSTKLYNSTVLVLGESHPSSIKIKTKIDEYNIEKTSLIDNRQILQDKLQSLRDELDKIREVVR
jgi:hypothetical protein